eukprot:gene27115-biopygen17668
MLDLVWHDGGRTYEYDEQRQKTISM